MSNRAKLVLIIAIMGITAGGYFLLRPAPQPPPSLTTMSALGLVGYDRAGRVKWRVRAARGTMDKTGAGTLHDITLALYAAGTPRLTVAAPTLTFSGDRARLAGGVTATLAGGYRLATAVVTWNKSTNLITGPEAVTISTADTHVSASGFSYAPSSGRLTLTGGVTARINRPTPITVTGEIATYTNGRIVFTDAVRIASKGNLYRCTRAEYSGNTVTLVGPVRASLTGGTLTAAQIEVTPGGSTASGEVDLQLNSSFFRGGNGT